MIASWKKSAEERRGFLALLLCVLVLYGAVLSREVRAHSSDYPSHIQDAFELSQHFHPKGPHFFFELLVIVAHAIVPFASYTVAGLLVALTFYLFLATILFEKTATLPYSAKERVGITLAALFTWPILLLAPIDRHLYFGYIAPNVLHNPTIVILKPLALLIFFQCIVILKAGRASTRSVAGLAVLSICATLAKPNFAICLLPALGLLFLFWRKSKLPAWIALFTGVALPSLLVLASQFVYHYTPAGSSVSPTGITFAPFVVFKNTSEWLLPKFLLSIAFPLFVSVAYRREAKADLPLILAWLIFIVGAFYTYFITETGIWYLTGNFAWCGQIASFVLFVMAILFFFRQPKTGRSYRVALGLLGLHVVGGLLIYGNHLLTKSATDLW